MSNEKLHIEVTASTDQAVAEVRKLQSEIDRLKKLAQSFGAGIKKATSGLNTGSMTGGNSTKGQDDAMRALRRRWTFETRMNRQRVAEERAVSAEQERQDRARRIGEDRTMRDFRDRMAIQRRTLREQAGMERDAERARASAMRETVRLDNFRFRLRERHARDTARDRARADREAARDARTSANRHADVRRDVGRSFGKAGDVSGRVVDAARSVSLLGTIGAGALAKLGSIGLQTRSRIDTSEANLRMFGGLSNNEVQAARSGWLNKSAVEFGFRPDAAINAFTETLKAGIPAAAAPGVTKTIMGASAGLDLDVPETTKLVGRLSTLTQDMANFDGGAIEKMLNGIAVVAKVTAADSKELVSSLRRGAGVLGSSKMSVQDLTAFTGVGISAGMQEGKAGTFMDFLVNDLVNARGARGQRGKDLDEGFRLLGLGSRGAVSSQAAKDPTELLLKMFERLNKMSPEKAGRAANLIGMREWRGEILMMSKAASTLRQTVEAERDPKNAGHLKQARDERLGTLAGLRSQVVATFDLAWEAVGGGIEDIVREVGAFFVNLGKMTDFDVIKAHVHTLIDGFVDGLGFKNITEMLESTFGKPGKLDYSTLQSFFDFAKGFGQGVREVFNTIKGIITAFTGTKTDANALGNLAAKVLGFGVALAFVAPYVSVLAGLGGALVAFGISVASIATALRAAGFIGGAGASAGAKAGAAAGAAGGIAGFLRNLFRLAPAAAMPLTIDPSKADKDKLMGRLGRWAQDREGGQGASGGTAAKPADPVEQWHKTVRDLGLNPFAGSGRDGPPHPLDSDRHARMEPTSFSGDVAGSVDRMNTSIREMGAHLEKIAFTSGMPALKAKTGETTQSMGGGVSTGGGQTSGFFTPDMKVPDWYGRSRGGGSRGAGAPNENFTGSNASVLKQAAASLGTSPKDLATVISYETAGKFSPSIKGGKGGNYQGLIQFGPAERAKYGVTGNETFAEQMPKVVRFLKDRGFKPGMGINQLYATINGGNPYVSQNASDGNGTIASHVAKMQRTHGARADAFLGSGDGSGNPDPVASLRGGGTGAGSAVDVALSHLGQNEHRDRAALSKFVGHDVAGSLNAWCARFVNASLRDAGIKGTGSAMANSFLKWGQAVDAEAVKKGDVAVEHRGRGPGAGGGHVGLATGNTRRNKQTGELEIETVSGNHGDAVVKDWTAASKLAIRRSTDAAASAAVASLKETAATAKRAQDGGTERLAPGLNPFAGSGRDGPPHPLDAPDENSKRRRPVDIGGGLSGVPFGGKPTADDIVSRVPAGIGRGAGGGGGSRGPVTIHNTMTVHGAGENPLELANKVQRQITADWNHRTHDLEPELT